VKPYYQDELVTLYLADSRTTLPLAAEVLICDPPYGVGLGVAKDERANGHGLAKGAYASYGDTYDDYCNVVVPVIRACVETTKRGAVFTGPHLQELPKASAIGGIYCPAGAGRHQWGFKTFLPVMFYGTDPLLNRGARPNVIQSSAAAEKNGHPCPKPIEWMRWLVDRVSLPGETVVDPFAGSGTTLVAAKYLGRKAVGIEVDESYCEIAARRLDQGVLDFGGAA
jgi:site-specific DNA-methyltransferase (adenine-specific)